MTQQDTSATDALAAELRRIIDQAEQLMGSAGVGGEALGELKNRVNEDHQFSARETRRSGAGRTPARAARRGGHRIVGALQSLGRPRHRRRYR
ncbi:MAG: hypothetical protein WDM77_17370 [Steroidobacteraceae bacterium]